MRFFAIQKGDCLNFSLQFVKIVKFIIEQSLRGNPAVAHVIRLPLPHYGTTLLWGVEGVIITLPY